MKPTEQDLTAWIAKNRMRFLFNRAHYSPDYVSWLARMNGFEAEMVYRRLSDFEHALALTNGDFSSAKKAAETCREIFLINNPNYLVESWEDLARYLTRGECFDEAA